MKSTTPPKSPMYEILDTESFVRKETNTALRNHVLRAPAEIQKGTICFQTAFIEIY